MREYIDADGVLLTREEYRAGLGKRPVRTRIVGFEESIVDQSKVAEADLNVLVKRWQRGDGVPTFAPGKFGDVSELASFQEMHNRLVEVESAFATLPAEVREHFQHSAVLFADALVDPARVPELVDLGLLEKPVVPEVPNEVPANPPA